MAFGTALTELRKAQKSAKGVSLYSRYVNRPVGRVLAAGAYRAGLRPNQVTLISAACTGTAIAAVALARPGWPLALGVYVGLVLGFAFDSADGQLARLRKESSAAGEWLDHVVDCAKITAVHLAVLISFYRFFDLPSERWLLLPLGFQLTAVLIFCGGLLADKLQPRAASPAGPLPASSAGNPAGSPAGSPGVPPGGYGAGAPSGPPAAAPSRLRAVALLPVDYGVFCVVFLLLGSEGAFLGGYAVLFAAHALFLVAVMAKWFRELSAADRSAAR